MKRLGLFFLSALTLLLPGCERESDSKMGEKLDKMIEQNDQVIELLKAGGGAGARGQAGQQRPQRPRPNPTDVYAVPTEGAAWAGAKDAKVTLVEAFEFA